MYVTKVFNNSVVLARDVNGRDVIVTGRGVGFQAKPGQLLDQSKVARTFVPTPSGAAAMGQLLAAIPPEHVALADEALDIARQTLGAATITPGAVVALADHVSFAIKRVQHGIELQVPLRAEVAHLYPTEMATAERMLAAINTSLEHPLPAEEAVGIAMHLVNAGFTTGNMSQVFQMTGLLRQIFQVLRSAYDRDFDTESVGAARFITHMRYFFVRAASGAQHEGSDNLNTVLQADHPEAFQCALRVRALLELRLGHPIGESELSYLTIHIARLTEEG